MANYDEMLKQKRLRVNKNIEQINKVCEELVGIDEKITYRIISEKINIPVKTLQNKYYKECIRKWKALQEDYKESEESNEYLEELKYLNNIIKQLRKQNEQLKYELYKNMKI